MLTRVQRRRVRVDGLELSYLEWGRARPGRSTLLYLHGLIATGETASALAAELPPDLHFLALDLPGAGASVRRGDLDASLRGLAGVSERFVDALGLSGVVLVGHSHGGAIALQMAANSPEGWNGLVLLAPAHPFSHHADGLIRFYLTAAGRLFASLLPWLPRWVHLIGFRQMAGPRSWSDPAQLIPYTNNLRTSGTVPHLLRILETWKSDMEVLGQQMKTSRLRRPVLLIWGDRDRAVPHTTAPALASHLLQCEQALLPGVGHRPAEEVPGECARLILGWLEDHTL